MIVSRRSFAALAASSVLTAQAAHAAPTLGNPDSPAQGVEAIKDNPHSGADPGPKNPAFGGQFPSSEMPLSTDSGDMPNFWFPFAAANKRLQDGGWARQVTVNELPIAKTLAAVDMYLTAGGIRELHWHLAAEWAFVLYGSARITAFDQDGRSFVADVKAGDLWNFPPGIPHSIQGLDPDGTEFLLVFDDGAFSEFDTLPGNAMDGAYAGRRAGQELSAPGLGFQSHTAAREIYLPGAGARSAKRRPEKRHGAARRDAGVV